MFFGSKISFADRWFLYLMLSNFSLRSTTRAYPLEHYSCCFSIIPYKRHNTNKTNVPADLHELLSAAKNLPELSIRIFNPLTSYFLIYRYVFRIADPYIRYSRIAYPTEQ